MRIQSLAFAAFLASASAFQTFAPAARTVALRAATADKADREEAVSRLERAAALSDYLSEAYDEKVKAIEEVEKKNQAEIDALKKQIADLKNVDEVPTDAKKPQAKKEAPAVSESCHALDAYLCHCRS